MLCSERGKGDLCQATHVGNITLVLRPVILYNTVHIHGNISLI